MFKAWEREERRGGVWLFYYPKMVVFVVESLIFSLYPGDIFLLCSKEDVSHMTMHILYWFTPTFLQKKKKIRRVLVLIKKISMFKVPCCCDLIKNKNKMWFHFVVLSRSETRAAECIDLYLLSYSLRPFKVLNTLAALNLFASSRAADTCQTPREERC